MTNVSKYRFNIDRTTLYLSLLHIVVIAILGVAIYKLYEGGFVSAWFASFVIAIMLLMALSIPKRIIVDEKSLSIDSLLDITVIDLDQIVSIKKISPRKIRWSIPIFGGCGFFGYYGHYFDFRSLRRFIIYATEWRYLVEIVDIYEDCYYISCRDRNRFIAEINQRQAKLREESQLSE